MIKPCDTKKLPSALIPLQRLSFEQKIYLNNEKVQDKHGKLVNLLYDLQHWHYFQKDEMTFKQKVELLNSMFGPFTLKKTLREKGETFIWLIDVNDSKYAIYFCSYALFMETPRSTDFHKVCEDTKEIAELVFKQAKAKPNSLKTFNI